MPDVTTCPKDFDAASRSLWTKTREAIKGNGHWRPEFSPLLERYVRAVEVARHARARIAARAKVNPEDAYTTTGARGQVVSHPDLKTAREAELDADARAKALLLSPESRSKGGNDAQKPPSGKFGGAFG